MIIFQPEHLQLCIFPRSMLHDLAQKLRHYGLGASETSRFGFCDCTYFVLNQMARILISLNLYCAWCWIWFCRVFFLRITTVLVEGEKWTSRLRILFSGKDLPIFETYSCLVTANTRMELFPAGRKIPLRLSTRYFPVTLHLHLWLTHLRIFDHAIIELSFFSSLCLESTTLISASASLS